MKKIISTFLFCALAFSSFAQDEKAMEPKDKKVTSSKNKKGDFLVSLLLGNSQYANSVSTWYANTGSVNLETPSTGVVTTENSLVNMIGAEGRYFVADKIAVKLAGGLILNNTPGRDQIDAITVDGTSYSVGIDAVEANEDINLNFTVGAEYHFATASKRLSPYIGFAVPFYYTRNTTFDTTYSINNGEVDFVYDNGVRQAILLGIGTQTYAGIDYHFNEDIYFGVQINALSYNYTYEASQAGEGLDLGQADTSGFSAFTQPVFKLGFRL